MLKRSFSLLFALVLGLFFFTPAFAQSGSRDQKIHVFFSGGCADCWPYTNDVLIPTIQQTVGISILQSEIHDFTVPADRKRMSDMIDEIGMPRSIADSLYAFVPTSKGTLVVLGHVPANLIWAALTDPNLPPKLVLWQPQMHGDPTEYRLWAWDGEVKTFPIATSFSAALNQVLKTSGPLPVGLANLNQLLPAVLVTGLLDYVSIITLLNAKTTLAWGLVYLFLYNIVFVLPLAIILLGLGNRLTAKSWARWEREHSLKIRLWYGLVMVAIGIIMLVWVI